MITLSRSFHKLGLSLLLGCLLAGCGGGKSGITSVGSSNSSLLTASPSDSVLLTLSSGTAADVSSFNSGSIYTLVTAEPSGKPESDSAPSTSYSFTLSSKAGTGAASSLLVSGLRTAKTTSSSTGLVYSKAQIACDNMFRAKEKKLLAKQTKQFSKKSASSSLLKSSLPSGTAIAKGTTWNGVYIWDYSKNTEAGKLTTISTTCQYVSDYAYFFVDNDDALDENTLKKYADAFDDTIYANNHKYFGEENDTDDNDKIIIVFSGKLTNGVLGYFNADDKYAYSSAYDYYKDSNEGDIIYVTTDTSYDGSEITDGVKMGTIAHEFQHMIYFDEHYNNGVKSTYTWLNEALSQAAEYYSGYTSDHLLWIESFLSNSRSGAYSGLSLTYWTDNNYGFGAIFIRYIIDQYGDTAIKKMCSTSLVGITAVENATGVDFNTLFTNFTRALVLLGTGYTSSNKEYNFTSTDLTSLRLTPLTGNGNTLTAGITGITGEIYPYSINYYSCSGTFGTMTLSGTSVLGTVFGLSK